MARSQRCGRSRSEEVEMPAVSTKRDEGLFRIDFNGVELEGNLTRDVSNNEWGSFLQSFALQHEGWLSLSTECRSVRRTTGAVVYFMNASAAAIAMTTGTAAVMATVESPFHVSKCSASAAVEL